MNNNPSMVNKILNGISSSLNIVNKVVPIYKEAKPLINSVSSSYKKIRTSGKDINQVIKFMKLKNIIKKDIGTNNNENTFNLPKTTNQTINNPKFFI